MSLTINDVYPWGRTLEEYRRMFALGGHETGLRLLGCADGPASFNAELTALGGRVVSCDPLYAFSGAEIRRRVEEIRDLMVERARADRHRFVWGRIASPEEMGRMRVRAMQAFLADYQQGTADGRYRRMSLPHLDFADDEFDLAVCSHFLFLYSDELDAAFHVNALVELCRVAGEARVFPLLDMRGQPSRHLPSVTEQLRAKGYGVGVERVDYEFQRGGNQMMRVRRR